MHWLTKNSGFFGFVLVLSLVALGLHTYLDLFPDVNEYWIYGLKGSAVFSIFALFLAAVKR